MSFIQFDPNEDIIISSENIIAPLWSGDVVTLTSGSFYSSSTQESADSGLFYLNSYNLAIGSSGSEVQYSVAYGHISGSGSAPFNGNIIGNTPSRNIYGQYRNLIYGDEGTVFDFGGSNGKTPDIFVININRARYKESLSPGSINLKLKTSASSGINTLYLTDDSNDSSTTTFIGTLRVYNIVSGSDGSSYNSSSVQTNSGSYGLFFPDIATIILNPRALAFSGANGGLNCTINVTGSAGYASSVNDNNRLLFDLISRGGNFELQSEETITSAYYDVHVKYNSLNYTTNPSIIDSNGNILYTTLIDNPQVYATTIGLYNDLNELMAVAKLTKPLPKDFTKTLTCRVKLQF